MIPLGGLAVQRGKGYKATTSCPNSRYSILGKAGERENFSAVHCSLTAGDYTETGHLINGRGAGGKSNNNPNCPPLPLVSSIDRRAVPLLSPIS